MDEFQKRAEEILGRPIVFARSPQPHDTRMLAIRFDEAEELLNALYVRLGQSGLAFEQREVINRLGQRVSDTYASDGSVDRRWWVALRERAESIRTVIRKR